MRRKERGEEIVRLGGTEGQKDEKVNVGKV